MQNRIFTLRALSPLHCGIGQGLNDIDLPTARNSVTGHPIVPGSSLKGVLKDHFRNKEGIDTAIVTTVFGKDESGTDNFASAVAVGDCNLVALPVRSFFGTYCYLASPTTLRILKSHFERCNSGDSLPSLPSISRDPNTENYHIIITKNSLLKGNENTILLEELDLLVEKETSIADKWATVIGELFFEDSEQQNMFKQRFAIADDNALNFLCTSALPVDAHIAIDESTGTVKPGALWYEETVPMETLMAGIVGMDKPHNPDCRCDMESMMGLFGTEPLFIQIGGKSTTGKGFVVANFKKGDK